MFNNKLIAIKQAILQANPYFDNGYHDVYLDEQRGFIHNDKVIFPQDTLGNYFYFRLPTLVRFVTNERTKVSDCVYGFSMVAPVILVAVVKDADTDILMQNLLNTLVTQSVSITGAVFDTASVILQELTRTDKKVQDAALARVGRHTIVSINFNLDSLFVPQTCILNPCKQC